MNHTNSIANPLVTPTLNCYRRWIRGAAFALMCTLSAILMFGSMNLQAEEPAAAPVAAVNINTADADALASALNGVGQARAEEIVRYRETYGKFASVEELAEIKGIGPSTLEKNRHLITLE